MTPTRAIQPQGDRVGQRGALRVVGFLVLTVAGVLVLGRYYSEPIVRSVPDFQRSGKTYPPIPPDSVRLLPYVGGGGCAPFDMLARLYITGKLFAPSDSGLVRALRREAAALGANAIAPTLTSFTDRPVPGLLERLFLENAADLTESEERSGRAMALRCNGPGFAPTANP